LHVHLFAEESIDAFLAAVCAAKIGITPKLHILEEHVPQFLTEWRIGLAYMGEQGGEKLHAQFNKHDAGCRAMRGEGNKLRAALTRHLISVIPDFYADI
jgi:hypothetical protein